MKKLRHDQQSLQRPQTGSGTRRMLAMVIGLLLSCSYKVFNRGRPWVRKGNRPPHKPGCGPPQHPLQPVWFHKWPGVPGREETGQRTWASASHLMPLPFAVTCAKMVHTGTTPRHSILPQSRTQHMSFRHQAQLGDKHRWWVSNYLLAPSPWGG